MECISLVQDNCVEIDWSSPCRALIDLDWPWLTLIDWSNPCRTLAPPTWWRWGRLCTGKVFLRRGILTTTTSTGCARQVLCSSNYHFETLLVNHKRQIVDRWRTYHVTYKCLRAQVNTSQAISNIDRWAPRWLGRTRRGGATQATRTTRSSARLAASRGGGTSMDGSQVDFVERVQCCLVLWSLSCRKYTGISSRSGGEQLSKVSLGSNSKIFNFYFSWEKHGHLGASITSGAFYDGEVLRAKTRIFVAHSNSQPQRRVFFNLVLIIGAICGRGT